MARVTNRRSAKDAASKEAQPEQQADKPDYAATYLEAFRAERREQDRTFLSRLKRDLSHAWTTYRIMTVVTIIEPWESALIQLVILAFFCMVVAGFKRDIAAATNYFVRTVSLNRFGSGQLNYADPHA